MPARSFTDLLSPSARDDAQRQRVKAKRPAPGVETMRAEDERHRLGAEITPPRRLTDMALTDYAAMVECAHDALIGLTLDGFVRTWNPGAIRLFGYSAAQAIGKSVMQLADPAQRDEQQHLLRQACSGMLTGPIETVRRRRDGTSVAVEMSVMPIRDADGRVVSLAAALRDISARKEVEIHKALLAEELNHRVKNTISTVQSIALQSLRAATSLNAFGETFVARLASLSATHNLLTRSAWEGAKLSDLVESELAPYTGSSAPRWWTLGPPDLTLDSPRALALGMMLHELATNAAKYGSLSIPNGRVQVSWETRTIRDARRLKLVWSESGGPLVEQPTRTGFGTRLVTDGLALALDGDVALLFNRAGVRCEVDVPLGAA